MRRDSEHVSRHEPGSDSWWDERASDPVGTRQRRHHGKLYPPFSRPTGPHQQASHTFHAAHYWPYPYDEQDRALVKSIWDNQIANGWNNATTLYDYHFDPETQELTQPGQNHVRWIMEKAPSNRRVAYVQSTYDHGTDQVRLAGVRSYVNHYTGSGKVIPPVLLRQTTPVGRPAGEIEAIRQAELGSIPSPRISLAISGGSAVGGGGGGGSAGGGATAGP